MAEAIYRRYRPMTFNDVTDQQHVKITIQNQITSGNVAHAYLFAGPRGVGKTTIARLLAKTVNCEQRAEDGNEPCNACSSCAEMNAGKALDIVEIDAASHTGVDNVRENIIEAVRFTPSKGKKKVFIIDEVHMLSTSAFNALLKTLEEPPAHALFVLATTEIHKIPQTILSRCQRFDFHRIAANDMKDRLRMIAKTEGVEVEEDVLSQVVRLSEGCLRDGESLLGQILALGEKKIGAEQASIILPITNTTLVIDLLETVAKNDVSSALNLLNAFVDQGGSIRNFIDELIDFVRTMLMLGLGAPYHDHYDADVMQRMQACLQVMGARRTAEFLDVLLEVKAKPSYDALPHLPLEVAIVLFAGDVKHVEVVETVKSVEDVQIDEVKKEPREPEAETAVHEESTSAATPIDPKSFTIEELKSKWGRCCAVIKQRSVALPLALQAAEILKCEDGILEIGFKTSFHFENINQPKNTKIISESINEVMQSNISIKPILIVSEEKKTLDTLVEAFGGQVVD